MTWLPSIRLGSQIVTRLCRWMNRFVVTPKHLGLTAILPVLLALAGGAALFLSGSAARVALLGGRPWQETRVEGRVFPKHLIDPAGMVQILPAPPRRIASAILSGDHILTALVAPDRLAAVTYLVDNPNLSNIASVVPASVPRIHAEIETILALQPDLVLVAGYTRATTVRLLVAAGTPFLSNATPSSSVASKMAEDTRAALKDEIRARLFGDRPDAPFSLTAGAFAVRGKVPGD